MPFEDIENIIAHFLVSFDIFVLEKIRVDRRLDHFENLVGSVLKKAAFRCHFLADQGFSVDTYFHKLDAIQKCFLGRVNEKSKLLAEKYLIPGFLYFDQYKEGTRSFKCNVPSVVSKDCETVTLKDRRKTAMKNIGMIPVINVESCDSFRLLKNWLSLFQSNDRDVISVMLRLRSIENVMFMKASSEETLSQYCHCQDLSDAKALVSIFDEYRDLAHYCCEQKSFAELLDVEEKSRALLVEWITYCILFSFVQRMHEVSSYFSCNTSVITLSLVTYTLELVAN